jgi:hypothetical protein
VFHGGNPLKGMILSSRVSVYKARFSRYDSVTLLLQILEETLEVSPIHLK